MILSTHSRSRRGAQGSQRRQTVLCAHQPEKYKYSIVQFDMRDRFKTLCGIDWKKLTGYIVHQCDQVQPCQTFKEYEDLTLTLAEAYEAAKSVLSATKDNLNTTQHWGAWNADCAATIYLIRNNKLKDKASYRAVYNRWYAWIVHHVLWRVVNSSGNHNWPLSDGYAGDIMECLFGVAVDT